ncbi:MAG: glycine-rich RNA-binding protein 4, mitochondrial-like isoform [Gammaproteobacteria bacterium]|jgi:RNA recognition motif-containing protein|nr:glycine-rich RNA-binding protein 4, mitochondrial-like isoform [Gammaproteobacteria bacterium]
MSNTVFVGNLSYTVEGPDLRSAFANFGDITEAKVIKDFHTGRSRGYGFVTFSTENEAQKAVDGMNDREINGRSVRVNLARNKTASNGGFGQNRGGFNRRNNDSYHASQDR